MLPIVRRAIVTVLISLLFACSDLPESAKDHAAVASAHKWLQLLDQGKYAESWQQAAPFVHQSLRQDKWVEQLTKARKPLGALKSRELTALQKVENEPGVPEGEHVRLRFNISMEHKMIGIETLVLSKNDSDQWQVVGYFIL